MAELPSPEKRPRRALGPRGPGALLISLWLVGVAAAHGAETTVGVFDRYAAAVVKIEVSETGSGAKGIIGSGFFVGDGTRLVTNYHVVSRLVHESERYVARIVDAEDRQQDARLVALDVLHDLAVLAVDSAGPARLAVAAVAPAQGTRLYALGFPHDIGLTIVEGTYNGQAEHSLYGRFHFTGSLNPGMSGGPAIDDAGAVVGVNVATAGNQVSFLVPLDAVTELLAAGGDVGGDPETEDPTPFLEIVERQLLRHQDTYHGDSLVASGKSVRLGPYELPTEPAPFFNCWADADRDGDMLYEVVLHECTTDDELFVSEAHRSGIVGFRHRLVTTETLNRFRFYSLLTDFYDDSYGWRSNDEDEVTSFACESGFVAQNGLALRVAFCARRYKKLDRLHDIFLRAVSLGEARSALETTLILSGVTLDKGRELTRSYLEAIRWRP